MEDVIDATPAGSGALQPQADLAFQMPKVAVREYGAENDSSSNELQYLHELGKESRFALEREPDASPPRVLHSRCARSGQLRLRGVLQREYQGCCEFCEQRDGFQSTRPHFLFRLDVLPLEQRLSSADEDVGHCEARSSAVERKLLLVIEIETGSHVHEKPRGVRLWLWPYRPLSRIRVGNSPTLFEKRSDMRQIAADG